MLIERKIRGEFFMAYRAFAVTPPYGVCVGNVFQKVFDIKQMPHQILILFVIHTETSDNFLST